MGFLDAVYAELGDRRRCEEIYRALLPYADRVGLLGLNASVCYGAVACPIAALAAALAQWQEADSYFETAAAINQRIGARPWLAYTWYEHARMLARHGRKADAPRVAALAKKSWSLASQLGILTLANQSRALMR